MATSTPLRGVEAADGVSGWPRRTQCPDSAISGSLYADANIGGAFRTSRRSADLVEGAASAALTLDAYAGPVDDHLDRVAPALRYPGATGLTRSRESERTLWLT